MLNSDETLKKSKVIKLSQAKQYLKVKLQNLLTQFLNSIITPKVQLNVNLLLHFISLNSHKENFFNYLGRL